MSEPGTDDALERAARRLDQALGQLEQRLNGAGQSAGSEEDRARLAAELDASRARERDLAQAGEQASQALGRAIAEIRAALAQTQERGAA
jgi:hypothetical protein